jgi:hypothetical protein
MGLRAVARARSTLRWIRAGSALSVIALSGLFGSHAAHAYVRTTTLSSNPPCPGSDAKPLYWNSASAVPFFIDSAGTPDVMGEAAFDAVVASFRAWEDVTGSYIAFDYRGKKDNAPVGFVRDGANVNVVKWIESGWAQSARAIAVTLTTYDCNTGEIFDADITLNGQFFQFTTEPRVGLMRADIANTVTHEVGHFIGFDHDPNVESTMYADAPLGETKKRSLDATDIDGSRLVYNERSGVCTKSQQSAPSDPGLCLQYQKPGTRSGGGCSSADSAGGLGAAWVLTLLLPVLLRRRRRV